MRTLQPFLPHFKNQKRQQSKKKEELELEKIKLEVRLANSNVKKKNWLFFFSVIQTTAIIGGISATVWQFVIKDRDDRNNKIKATLEYVNKFYQTDVKNAQDSLEYLANLIPNARGTSEDEITRRIAVRFDKETAPLASFYNILQSGIDKGYFDKDLSEALLNSETTKFIYTLNNLQSKKGGTFKNVNHPDYKKFKGLIDFYIAVQDTSGDFAKALFPRYEYNKPFPCKKFTRGYSPPDSTEDR